MAATLNPVMINPVAKSSVRDRVGQDEWRVRVDLAAAYQLASLFRWTDLIYTHFSARVPGSDDFLINAYGLMFDEITASNLVKIDKDGNILDDPLNFGYNEAGFVIHGCVHEARPEINCVIHTHTRAGAAVSAMKCGLLPISQHAQSVEQTVTYHDYEGIALEMDERGRMAKDLGKESKAMILRNHGLLTLGTTVHDAWELMYYLDLACQIQVDACAGGLENVLRMSGDVAKKTSAQYNRPTRGSLTRSWPALLRLLDRKNISYKD